MDDKKQFTEVGIFSVVDAMMYARVAQLYFIYLRKRSEVLPVEKSQLTSIITKISTWIDEKRQYMVVRHPDIIPKVDEALRIEGDAIADLSMLTNFIVKNAGDTEWINLFLPKEHGYKTLEKYHQLRVDGMSEDEAIKTIY